MGTENRNEKSKELDLLGVGEIITLMNEETAYALEAVEGEKESIENLITGIIERNADRIIYAGAGTSGRLGVLDASECPPTFNTDPDEFIGIIAGGDKALRFAIEGAEDSEGLGETDVLDLEVGPRDCVIGIAASGRTPYVKGALRAAKEAGALTGSISNNKGSDISDLADFPVEVASGPEILTGSTRLKAGTAQKLVLNMISTIINIKRGKIYGNYMVDVNPSNWKLERRAINMIREITEADERTAADALSASGRRVKTAVLMVMLDVDREQAESLLSEQPDIRKILTTDKG
ncbi:N-acetylmuramic acid-6-phosphate etherase [Salinicoccus sediminis]|uniref:N-acetylmuramic acid 6-phosphate etherase n=1 Tax=Salinicoccus sediminis TaxID=1432562 RepID=A0A0M2SQ27_9STAP|nr:N-acetylmuramic acid 6-phosphate etherase [Salinicoccus sediminis]KKK35052.1 N-acetylmuramic acid-6-phosphate etherase [Salinicoccus sediminis]